MHLVLFEVYWGVEVAHLTVNAGAHITGLAQVLHHLLVLALAIANDGREHHYAGALRQRLHRVHDLLHGLLVDFPPAVGALRVAGEPLVFYLGHCFEGMSVSGIRLWISS